MTDESINRIMGKLNEVSDKINALHTYLKDNGLTATVKENCKDIKEHSERIQRLNLRFWVLVALLVANGVISANSLANLLSR